MSLSNSDVADLYRNVGKPVPAEFRIGHGEDAPQYEKYGRIKKEVDGIMFDSTLEADVFILLKLWRQTRFIFGLDLQPEYILADGFRDGTGIWRRAVKMRLDFRFAYMSDQNKIICVDAKGAQTPAFRIKEKLFLAKFPDIDLQVWNREKVRELIR